MNYIDYDVNTLSELLYFNISGICTLMLETASPEERGRRLKLAIKMTGLNQKEFVEKHNLRPTTIQSWVSASQGGLTDKGAKKIVDVLELEGIYATVGYLMYGFGEKPYYIDNKNINGIENFTDIESNIDLIRREIAIFSNQHPQAITLKITKDDMEPVYKIGNFVGGFKLHADDIEKAIGEDCIIEIDENEYLCRRLTRGSSKGLYNLSSINQFTKSSNPILYDIKIISAAPIVRHWRDNNY